MGVAEVRREADIRPITDQSFAVMSRTLWWHDYYITSGGNNPRSSFELTTVIPMTRTSYRFSLQQ